MKNEEIKKFLFYKRMIKKSKEKLIDDFNDKMENLLEAEAKINEELKKLNYQGEKDV